MPLRRDVLRHAMTVGAVDRKPPTAGSTGLGVMVLVDQYLELGADDDAPAIRRAIAVAVETGRVVAFSGRVYRIGSTIELPSGIHLVGTGSIPQPAPAGLTGTVLRRIRNCVMLQARGRSDRAGGPMRTSIALRDILFDGADFASDMVRFIAATRIGIDDCFFARSKGRILLLWEVFDSRITNTDFEWGGAARSELPMIELRSGRGLEYTNHIHFVGCRCESYPGTAIALTGTNTNKIFFTNCKLESGASNDPALRMGHAVMVHFNGLQITGRGTPDAQLSALLEAHDCVAIFGDLCLEYQAWDTAGARLKSYLDLGNSQSVDLTLCTIDGLKVLPVENYVSFDPRQATALTVRGFILRGGGSERHEWKA